MNPLLKLSTPAAAGAFLVVGVTGVMMFFHLAQEQVEEMHQWFGVVMVTAVLLHLARNWAALKGYPKRGPALWVALVARLQSAGLQGVTADASPAAIAAASGVEPRAVMEQITQPPRP